MALYVEVGALLAALFLLYLLLRFLKDPRYLIANSILGIILFLVLDFFGAGIPISLLSIGIVALGGATGVILVVILHFLGFGF